MKRRISGLRIARAGVERSRPAIRFGGLFVCAEIAGRQGDEFELVRVLSRESSAAPLLACLGIDHNGHWPVIDERNLHVCAKFSSGDGLAEVGGEFVEEHFVERRGGLRFRRANVGRAISFLRAGEEGELADDENFPACFLYRAVHHALIVIEQAEPRDLA